MFLHATTMTHGNDTATCRTPVRAPFEVDIEYWAEWREENDEDCTRAWELADEFITRYGPTGFYD